MGGRQVSDSARLRRVHMGSEGGVEVAGVIEDEVDEAPEPLLEPLAADGDEAITRAVRRHEDDEQPLHIVNGVGMWVLDTRAIKELDAPLFEHPNRGLFLRTSHTHMH